MEYCDQLEIKLCEDEGGERQGRGNIHKGSIVIQKQSYADRKIVLN
jgi:hypothetical protein